MAQAALIVPHVPVDRGVLDDGDVRAITAASEVQLEDSRLPGDPSARLERCGGSARQVERSRARFAQDRVCPVASLCEAWVVDPGLLR